MLGSTPPPVKKRLLAEPRALRPCVRGVSSPYSWFSLINCRGYWLIRHYLCLGVTKPLLRALSLELWFPDVANWSWFLSCCSERLSHRQNHPPYQAWRCSSCWSHHPHVVFCSDRDAQHWFFEYSQPVFQDCLLPWSLGRCAASCSQSTLIPWVGCGRDPWWRHQTGWLLQPTCSPASRRLNVDVSWRNELICGHASRPSMAGELGVVSVSNLVHQFKSAESLTVLKGRYVNTNFGKIKSKFFTLFWLRIEDRSCFHSEDRSWGPGNQSREYEQSGGDQTHGDKSVFKP